MSFGHIIKRKRSFYFTITIHFDWISYKGSVNKTRTVERNCVNPKLLWQEPNLRTCDDGALRRPLFVVCLCHFNSKLTSGILYYL